MTCFALATQFIYCYRNRSVNTVAISILLMIYFYYRYCNNDLHVDWKERAGIKRVCSCPRLTNFELVTVNMTQQIEIIATWKATEVAEKNFGEGLDIEGS